jgi:hypothetical protein
MTAGSTPATAVATIRAIGRNPRARARSASTTSAAEAPSLMPLELPAVTVPPSRKAGRRRASASGGLGPGCSSAIHDDRLALALRDRDRHELVAIATLGDRRGGVALAGQGEGVLLLAADAQPLGHVLAGLAHRIGVVRRRQCRVDEAPAQRRVDQIVGATLVRGLGLEHHVRARLIDSTPPAMKTSPSPDGDGVGGRIDGLQAAAAQPVDRQAADLDRQPGQQSGHSGDVAVVLAGLVGAAEDHVLDDRRVDARTLDEGSDDGRGKIVGPDRRQGPAVAPERSSERGDDPGLANGSIELACHVPCRRQ